MPTRRATNLVLSCIVSGISLASGRALSTQSSLNRITFPISLYIHFPLQTHDIHVHSYRVRSLPSLHMDFCTLISLVCDLSVSGTHSYT